jgi:hypothetical protein
MIKTTAAILAIALAAMTPALGQLKSFTPVTPKMLENPNRTNRDNPDRV